MIVCDDAALADDLRSLRAHGWVRDRSDRSRWRDGNPDFDERFLFILPGYNVRPTEIQGALGSVQLQRLDAMLESREALAAKAAGWAARFAPWLRLIGSDQLAPSAGHAGRRARSHSWMTLPFVIERAGVPLRGVMEHFERNQVETRPIIAGNLSRHPAAARYASRTAKSLKQCDALLERGFMIGCHPTAAPGVLDTLEEAFRLLGKAF